MKTFRLICFIACLILLGIHIYSLNYNDLSFSTNESHYLGIFAMFFIGLSFLLTMIRDWKNK